MITTEHRYIKDFKFDVKSYREFKHKHEPSNICEMPVKWKEAKNFYVFDDKGNRWIDMTSGIFVTNAGHSNPYINEAIKNQVDSDLTFAYQYNTDIRNEFVEKLLEILNVKPFKSVHPCLIKLVTIKICFFSLSL